VLDDQQLREFGGREKEDKTAHSASRLMEA
jgi:hypothetical protein